jgi:hypothetical protein
MQSARSTASVESGPALRTVDQYAGQPPYLPVLGVRHDRAAWVRLVRNARCTGSSLAPDEWFPVSAGADRARREAAAAIAVCMTCLVRPQCLAFSLQHWDIGRHGVWGGLVTAERAALRRGVRP